MNQIKKIILITGLMLSGSLFAETKTCHVFIESAEGIRATIKKCKGGDILTWVGFSNNTFAALILVSAYCDQEKPITVRDDLQAGICTYTGEMLMPREG